jgi:hypothetical protein
MDGFGVEKCSDGGVVVSLGWVPVVENGFAASLKVNVSVTFDLDLGAQKDTHRVFAQRMSGVVR